MINVIDVTHRYAPGGPGILNSISFSINEGDFVALTGPSGIGKSTLAHIIVGFVAPSGGRILINGEDVTGRPNRKRILISQESDLFPWQTVENHLLYALQKPYYEKPGEISRNLLNMVKLTGFETYYPHQLSGGMKKRLSIARALAINPELLILDEAFSSLDCSLKASLYTDLKDTWQQSQTSILLIAHDVNDVHTMARKEIRLAPSAMNPGGACITSCSWAE